MSFVTTAKLTAGHSRLLSWSSSAVFPLPTGPAIPTRYALMMCRFSSEQKVTLRQRQNAGRLAGQQLAIRPHFIGLRIDFDVWHCGVVDHVPLPNGAAVLHGHSPLFHALLDR